MSRESIQKIKEAEARAEQLVEEAGMRAQAMIAESRSKGEALCQTTERETAEAIGAMMVTLRERTVAMTERVANESLETVEKMKTEAALRKRSAEKIVVRGLMSKCR